MFVGLCCNTSTTEWRTRASILPPHRTQPPCASICGPGRRKVFQRQRHASAAEGAAAAAANSTDRNPYGWDTVIENSNRTPTRTRREWCYRRRAVPHLNLHTPGYGAASGAPGSGRFCCLASTAEGHSLGGPRHPSRKPANRRNDEFKQAQGGRHWQRQSGQIG